MVLSCIALWPKWKDGLTMFRDVVLWVALAFIAVIVLNNGGQRLFRSSSKPTPPSSESESFVPTGTFQWSGSLNQRSLGSQDEGYFPAAPPYSRPAYRGE